MNLLLINFRKWISFNFYSLSSWFSNIFQSSLDFIGDLYSVWLFYIFICLFCILFPFAHLFQQIIQCEIGRYIVISFFIYPHVFLLISIVLLFPSFYVYNKQFIPNKRKKVICHKLTSSLSSWENYSNKINSTANFFIEFFYFLSIWIRSCSIKHEYIFIVFVAMLNVWWLSYWFQNVAIQMIKIKILKIYEMLRVFIRIIKLFITMVYKSSGTFNV